MSDPLKVLKHDFSQDRVCSGVATVPIGCFRETVLVLLEERSFVCQNVNALVNPSVLFIVFIGFYHKLLITFIIQTLM